MQAGNEYGYGIALGITLYPSVGTSPYVTCTCFTCKGGVTLLILAESDCNIGWLVSVCTDTNVVLR